MAYTNNFLHDVFISYAVADNGTANASKPGWVQSFEMQLAIDLKRHLSKRTEQLSIWIDRKRLSCGDDFHEEIGAAIDSSATMVVLLSKQYLASPYCRLERSRFLNAANVKAKRLFAVELTNPTDLASILPQEFATIQRAKLWSPSINDVPVLLGFPKPDPERADHAPYYDAMNSLARTIADRLDSFDNRVGAETPSPGSHSIVFMGSTISDSKEDDFATDIRKKLTNSTKPIHVTSRGDADSEKTVEDLIRRSHLLIQTVGCDLCGDSESEAATAKDLGIPIQIFRRENLDLQKVKSSQKDLVKLARAVSVEIGTQLVIEHLVKLRQSRQRGGDVRVTRVGQKFFINYLPEDENLARQVVDHLSRKFNLFCDKRSYSGGSETEISREFEEALLECDNLLMVYGAAKKLAAKSQVKKCFQLIKSSPKNAAFKGDWFVVAGPPMDAGETLSIDLGLPGISLVEIDARNDIETALQSAFAESMPGGAE